VGSNRTNLEKEKSGHFYCLESASLLTNLYSYRDEKKAVYKYILGLMYL